MKVNMKEEDFGYKRHVDIDTRYAYSRHNFLQTADKWLHRVAEQRGRHKVGKEPSKATIFMTRTIIEALSRGIYTPTMCGMCSSDY